LGHLHAVSSVSDTLGTLSRRSQRLGHVWDASTPYPASQTCLERLHAVPSLSDPFGTLSRHLQRPRHAWNACTPFPASRTHLRCLYAISGVSESRLEGFQAVSSVSRAFGRLAGRLQHLRRVWRMLARHPQSCLSCLGCAEPPDRLYVYLIFV
jgi:hypothetical protein